MKLALSCWIACVATAWASDLPPSIQLHDVFGRDIQGHAIELLDWEGPCANPALQLTLLPSPRLHYPLKVLLSTVDPHIRFDLPSTVGRDGAAKELYFLKRASQPFWMTTMSKRELDSGDSTLAIEIIEADGKKNRIDFPVRIVSREPETRPNPFAIHLDFSQDRSGLFRDHRVFEQPRELVGQAADDWAFYLANVPLDPVPAGAEKTWVGNAHEPAGGHVVTNAQPYTGYLLYAIGSRIPELLSYGGPSQQGGTLVTEAVQLGLKRSGVIAIDDRTDWRNDPNSFYSIAHHEIGHALFFDDANPKFAAQKRTGVLSDDKILKYVGHPLRVDGLDHFPGAVDPVSLRGAFGNEQGGRMPHERWVMTKLDLLLAQVVGYRLRPTSVTEPMLITAPVLPVLTLGRPFHAELTAEDVVPFLKWELAAGKLPPGMQLDPFSGEISGTPQATGTYRFTIRLFDSDPTSKPIDKDLMIRIESPKSASQQAMPNAGPQSR